MKSHARFIPLLLLTVLFFQGCAVWDFVDTRWQNATGYFNTYYNAIRTFEQAEDEIKQRRNERSIDPQHAAQATQVEIPEGMPEAQRKQIQRDMAMEQGSVPSSAIVLLDKVIEKCSRILINYPKSKWVDNSLLLIGKSYYYKKEPLRAERKFQELLDRYPDSDLVPEAILWLGMSYTMLEDYEKAEITLNRAVEVAIEEEEADVASLAYYELGKMHLLQGNRAQAVADYEEAVTFAADRDELLQVQLSLAREYERLGETEKAAKAYSDIFRLDPSTDLAFIAELNYAKLTRMSGDLDDASNTLINMLENPQYLDYDAKIQLEIAHLYYAYHERYLDVDDSLAADAFDAALEQYTFVDTTFSGTAEAADAFYEMGRIYEYDVEDYDNAYENYSQAKLAFPGVESARKGEVKEKIFGDYRKLRNQISMKDTTLFFALNPDSLRVRDSLKVIADSLDREKKIAEGVDEKNMTDEQRMAERFRRRRPHGRNTGRVNPWEMELEKQQAAMAAGLQNTQGAMKAAGPEYRRVDLTKVNPDSLRRVIASLQMEMGWQMYDRIENVDSARWYYQKAFDGNLSDSLRPQALYTMAAIERNTGNEEGARQFEDQLVGNYPTSPYAHSIMELRGMPLPKDSTAIAQEAYDAAADVLENGNRQQGIAMMKQVMADYPNSEIALRAQLAIAMLYEENRGEEALAMYKEMVKEHPNSPYSKRGHEILEAIEGAKRRAEQEKIDAAREAERKRKAEEERKRIERRYQNPLLDEELRLRRDSVRTEEKQVDPTKDKDFPLRLPGSTPPDEDGGEESGEEQTPKSRPSVRPNPDSIDPQNLPGDTLRRLTPPVPIERK
ncbi:tetratricopeptide repeat protein [bacterium]|nr:tetratricopeptide repeat protein [bacterium]